MVVSKVCIRKMCRINNAVFAVFERLCSFGSAHFGLVVLNRFFRSHREELVVQISVECNIDNN